MVSSKNSSDRPKKPPTAFMLWLNKEARAEIKEE